MGLGDLIKKQKEQGNAAGTQPAASAPRRFGSAAVPAKPSDATPAAAEPVSLDTGAAQHPAEDSAGQAAGESAKPKFGGLVRANAGGSLVARTAATTPVPSEPVADSGAFDSLEAISGATSAGVVAPPRESHATSMLEGETAASAPTRELPEDMTDGMKLFVESLDGIYDVLFDAELFGNMTKNIMVELSENPEYIKLIADEDVHTMIRGMRDAMGLARIKKVESKRGTGTRKTSAKTAQTAESVELLDNMFNADDF